MRRTFLRFVAHFLLLYVFFTSAIATTIQYTYDDLGRITQAESTDGTMVITYTYDNVGNRLTLSARGTSLDTPEVTDAGLFSLDNNLLDILISTYGDEYGDLRYEFAIGTSAGASNVVGWKGCYVEPYGSVTLDGLNLPFGKEYFVSVRIVNFAGHVVSETGCSDGIIILDPYADPDADGADNQLEIDAGSNPFNINSYPAVTAVYMRPGFNLTAIPSEMVYQPDLRDWLPILGNTTEIEKAMVYDDDARKFVTQIPGDSSNQSFMLKGGEGLIVYTRQDKEITFTSVLCSKIDLKPGFNIAGFACPEEGYSVYQLLNDLGSENVSSIQRYSTEKGAFETAGFDQDGQIVGVDFYIVPGEGYFVYMNHEVSGFSF
jgi:YD repeat-containing protein